MTTTPWHVFALAALLACSTEPADGALEICTGGLDDDGDGWIDCDDQDCWGRSGCAPSTGGDVLATTDSLVPDSDDTGHLPVDSVGADAHSSSEDAGPDSADDAPTTSTDTGAACDPCGTGSLKGKVCAPNDQIFVNAAKVTLDTTGCDGQPVHFEVLSDAKGEYTFEGVPCGSHLVRVEKGSFQHEYQVQIEAGQLSDITGAASKLCFRATGTAIAVLDGSWDSMEGLLEALGLEYDFYNENGDGNAKGSVVDLLGDPAALSKYDIIFANCGAYHGWMPIEHAAVMPNVKSYVLGGGSLYMSDYAWAYGEWSFPDAIEFMRSDNVNDMFTDKSPQIINGGQTFEGVIADGAMAAYVGKTSLPITFDQGPQIAPEVVGEGTFPHISAKVKQLSFDDPIDITMPLVMSYRPEPTAGLVVYTNFHNDAQTTADMLKILQYLVFTL